MSAESGAPTSAQAVAATVTRPSLGQLLGLSWPIIISRSAQSVVGFTDAVMVGKLGESALAATTTGAMNAFAAFVLPMGTVFIVSSFVSQLAGAGQARSARRFAYYGLGISALGGLACILFLALTPWILSFFSYSPEVRLLLIDYLTYRLISGGFAVGLEALGNYYGGLGNTRLPMMAQVFAMVLNVALCWVLIYGHLGLPALGVRGSALASTIATFCAFLALFSCFLLGIGEQVSEEVLQSAPGPHDLPMEPIDANAGLSLREFGRMLRFGLPSGLNWFIEFAAFWIFTNVVLAGLGTTALAAVMAVFQLTSISFLPSFAIASAGAIFVGRALGARLPDDVPPTVRLTMLTACAWQGMIALSYLLFPSLFMHAFLSKDVDAHLFLDVGVRVLMLSTCWQLFDAISMAFAEALRAAGDTLFTFWTRAFIAWGIFTPGSLISVRIFKLSEVAAVAWLVVYLALLSLVLYLRFRTGRWRSLNLTGST